MKALIIVATLFLSGAYSFGQGVTGDMWVSAKQNRKGTITLTYTHAPKFSEMHSGQHKGLCFDIMNEFIAYVKTTHGITLSIKYEDLSDDMNFDLFLKTVKESTGGVFGLGDVSITSDRQSDYNFGAPYFSNVAILATSIKVPTLSSMSNLNSEFAGKTIVVQKGTTHENRAYSLKDNFPGLIIETTNGFIEANEKVSQSTSYFTYIDFSTYLDVVGKRIPLKRHNVGDQKGEDFGFIMPKDSDWVPIFNEFMAADGGFTKSDVYKQILSNNLGGQIVKLMDIFTK